MAIPNGRILAWLLAVLCLIAAPIPASAATPALAAAYDHVLALDANGNLSAWGDDTYGQLGTGRQAIYQVPQRVPVNGPFAKVAAGQGFSLAFKSDGALWVWGDNRFGQLGDGTTTDSISPKQVATGFIDVAAGDDYSIGLKADGSLWVWGNSRHTLGQNSPSAPTQIGTGFQSISAGSRHAFAMTGDGSLWGWGNNTDGQLGDGTQVDAGELKLIGSSFKAVAPGAVPTLGLKSDGSLWAWGSNGFGQLGDGTTTSSPEPKPIGADFVAIAAGGISAFSLAIKSDGSLWFWGNHSAGLIDDGASEKCSMGENCSKSPQQIGTDFATISAVLDHALALKRDGTLWSWGWNFWGELGDGTTTRSFVPKQIATGYSAAIAGRHDSFAIASDGSLWAWGSRERGQLGEGATSSFPYPGNVGSGYTTIAAGTGYSLAVKADGTLWAWGSALAYVSGPSMPTQIGAGFRSVASGRSYHLALQQDDSLWAWNGIYGSDLGGGVPTLIGSGFSAVAAGWEHALAVKTDGTLWTWGWNAYGQLGDGTTTNRNGFTQIGTDFVRVAAGGVHSLALKSDGGLWAWGANTIGQLGIGSSETCFDSASATSYVCSTTPQLVGTGFIEVTAGDSYSLALKNDGSVWAWGSNESGQLGDGTSMSSASPMRVPGLGGVVTVAAGGGSSLAVKSDGSVFSWGANNFGQLGDGTFAQRRFPVLVVNGNVDGFLNLHPGTDFEIPPGVGVPFFAAASGGITDTRATVNTSAKFNASDAGKSGAVFVTAAVPPGSLVPVPSAASVSGASAGEGGASRPIPGAEAAATSSVLIQLTASGWQPVVNGQLIPYASGVLGDQLAAQTLLSNADTANLKGAQFCLGYGASADQMLAAGTMRVVATVPDPNAAGAAAPSCIVAGPAVSYGLSLPQGWNLLGNSLNQSLSVASLYGDSDAVITVWKWDTGTAGWQFYTPLMDVAALQTYAAGKGYAVLSTINPGEGYWVNARAQPAIGTQSGASFIVTSTSLVKGWNLVATGNDITPTQFNATLKTSLSGKELTTLWAWDNPASKWYFYAPSLETQGGTALSGYIASKGYLDFGSKTLGGGIGFWVNR